MSPEKQNAPSRRSSIERILERVDNLDQTNMTILIQRLARERELLETVFDSVEEGIFVISSEGTIDYANSAGMEMIGLNKKEIGSAIFWKLVPNLAGSLVFLREGGLAPNVARDAEIFYPEHRWVRLQISRLVFGGSNESVRYGIIMRDITAEQRNTEEMIENERVNSIFTLAASVAHEIGNPLNSIKIHLDLMKRKLAKLDISDKKSSALKKSVDVCLEEASRLDDILKNFLGAIRPQKPALEKTNLMNVVLEVLSVQKVELENKNIRCSVTQEGEAPVIRGDEGLLKQMLFNVIKNAMEAMQDGGSISIVANCDDSSVYVRISDTGCGIERDAISKIYEPFFTTKEGGHGLGMMIVMRIMHEHGGQVGIDSTPGEGTTVTLQFPRIDRRAPQLDLI